MLGGCRQVCVLLHVPHKQTCDSFAAYISRNCSEHGWSEPYPSYEEACEFAEDESTQLEVNRGNRLELWSRPVATATAASHTASLLVDIPRCATWIRPAKSPTPTLIRSFEQRSFV